MDRVSNPYVPGAGTPPPELAGRSAVLEDARVALERVKAGKSAQSLILVGLRGVGKTVLLVRMRDMAEDIGFRTILIESEENKNLPQMLVPALRSLILGLDPISKVKDKFRKSLRVLRSFIGKMDFSYGDFGLTIEPEVGKADSGVLQNDLSDMLIALGEAAQEANTSICILIDELQYIAEPEFAALITAVHKTNQLRLPVIVIGAGLPQTLALAGSSKSYAERLFKYPKIGALETKDAEIALTAPAEKEKASYSQEALNEVLRVTEKYPYFIQQWGHDSWNISKGPTIEKADVEEATKVALATLDESFFKVRFDRCTPSEKRYMRALAELGPGTHRSGDIAEKLGVKSTSVAPTRSKLIAKGMIYSPQHGETAFTVPLFDAYMRRAIPRME